METINKKELIKTLKDEMAEATANVGGKRKMHEISTGYIEIEELNPSVAFDYGYYRACESLIVKYS